MPDQDAAGDVERVVHAAVHPCEARRMTGTRIATAHARSRSAAVAEPRRDEQGEPDVDGDGRRGVTGREGGVGRKVVEPRDVRPLARDRERRHAVGRRLHRQREDREGRDPPLAEQGADERDRRRPGSAGSGAPPSADPTSEASVRNGVRSATIVPTTLSSVRARPPAWSSTSVTRSPSAIPISEEDGEAREDRREEDRGRMVPAQSDRRSARRARRGGRRAAAPPIGCGAPRLRS